MFKTTRRFDRKLYNVFIRNFSCKWKDINSPNFNFAPK